MPDTSKIVIEEKDFNFKDTTLRSNIEETQQNWSDFLGNKILGICADFENSTFTRLGAAEGLEPGSDFDQFKMYQRQRCNVANDGTINAYYGDINYKEDGSNGQVMVKQPKFYYKTEILKLEEQYNAETNSNGKGYYIRKANYWISEQPRAGFKLHPAFKNENGEEVDYFFDSAYEGSLFDTSENLYIVDDAQVASFEEDLLCSIGQDPYDQRVRGVKPISGSTQNLTRPNSEKLAKNRGLGWHIDTIWSESAIQLLIMIEFCSDIQRSIGAGVTNFANSTSSSSTTLTGATSSLGNTSGAATLSIHFQDGVESTIITTSQQPVSWRGRENPYGNIDKWVEGIIVSGNGEENGGVPYICSDFNFDESSTQTYQSADFTIPNSNGWIKSFGFKREGFDWLLIPSEFGGNSSTIIGDYCEVTSNNNTLKATNIGGDWTSRSNTEYGNGLFAYTLTQTSLSTTVNNSARLIYIPVSSGGETNA